MPLTRLHIATCPRCDRPITVDHPAGAVTPENLLAVIRHVDAEEERFRSCHTHRHAMTREAINALP